MDFYSIVRELCEDAHARGLSWARTCAATTMTEADRRLLEDEARSLATRLHATPFDPKVNREDQLALDAYKQRVSDLEDGVMAHAISDVRVKRCEQDLANHVVPNEPQASVVVIACGAVLLAVGFALG